MNYKNFIQCSSCLQASKFQHRLFSNTMIHTIFPLKQTQQIYSLAIQYNISIVEFPLRRNICLINLELGICPQFIQLNDVWFTNTLPVMEMQPIIISSMSLQNICDVNIPLTPLHLVTRNSRETENHLLNRKLIYKMTVYISVFRS